MWHIEKSTVVLVGCLKVLWTPVSSSWRPGASRTIDFPMPNAHRALHGARRTEAHPSLPAMPARNLARTRSRKTCPSLRYPTTLRASPRPQAHAASARGLRPPGKRPPFLHRPSSAQTIWIPPRFPNACRLPHAPPASGLQRAPATTAARAPLDPSARPRPTARPRYHLYQPRSAGLHVRLVYRTLDLLVRASRCES